MKITSISVLLALTLLVSCHRDTVVDSSILARVGDEVLTVESFKQAARERLIGPDEKSRRALLDELINEMRAYQLAKQRGYDRDPDLLKQQRSLLIAKVREVEGLHNEVPLPSEQAIRDYYDRHSSEFQIPARIHAALILVHSSKLDTADYRRQQRAKIDSAYEQAAAHNVDFRQLALQYSEDQSTRYNAGDLGWQMPQASEPDNPITAAIATLSAEQPLSRIIETPDGWFFVKLLEHQPAAKRPYSSTRGEIIAKLKQKTSSTAESRYFATLKTVPTETHPDRLPQIDPNPSRLSASNMVPPSAP